MENLWNQGWFALELAWYRVRYEVDGHITLIVVVLSISFLLWVFLSPGVRNRS